MPPTASPVNQVTPPTAGPLTRPTLVDFLVLVAGFGLSLGLIRLSLFTVEPSATADARWQSLVPLLPDLLRLTEGAVLMWPVLFAGQRLRGRTDGLTVAEWLWVFSWLGVVTLTAVAAWNTWAPLPPISADYVRWLVLGWYVIAQPIVAFVALLTALFGAFARAVPPWTHALGLALLLWPVAPLAAVLLLGKFVF